MDTYSVFLSVLLLFGNFHASDCTVTHEDDIHNCEKTFTISWLYTDAADMSTVVWEFIKSGSASQTIMIQTPGSNASVLGGFNVLHISNGIVNITNPTLAANNGTYQITVTYSTSATAAVDAVNVFEYVSPTGLRYSNTSSGNNITFTCAATSFGGPVPATLYIKVGQVDRNSITATVIKDAEDVQCCLDGDAANVCLGEKKCVYAQHKSNTTTSDGSAKQILCSIAISFASSVIIGGIILIAYGPIGNVVAWNLTRFDVAAIVYGIVVGFYSVIVGAITVDKNGDCSTCNHNNGLAIASIVLGCIGIAVVTVLLAIRVVSGKRKQPNDQMKDGASSDQEMIDQHKTSL